MQHDTKKAGLELHILTALEMICSFWWYIWMYVVKLVLKHANYLISIGWVALINLASSRERNSGQGEMRFLACRQSTRSANFDGVNRYVARQENAGVEVHLQYPAHFGKCVALLDGKLGCVWWILYPKRPRICTISVGRHWLASPLLGVIDVKDGVLNPVPVRLSYRSEEWECTP